MKNKVLEVLEKICLTSTGFSSKTLREIPQSELAVFLEKEPRKGIKFCKKCGSDKIKLKNLIIQYPNFHHIGGAECLNCGFEVEKKFYKNPNNKELVEAWNKQN